MTYITITREQLTKLGPCKLESHLERFGTRQRMGVRAAFKAGTNIRDILWLAGELGLVGELVEFAEGCAERSADYAARAADYAARAADYARDAAGYAAGCARGARYAAGCARGARYAADAARGARYAADAARGAAGYARDAAGCARDAAGCAAKERKAQEQHLIKLFGTR